MFDLHGTLGNRLPNHELLGVVFTKGKADITNELQEVYEELSTWPEKNELKLHIVLDEGRLLNVIILSIVSMSLVSVELDLS